MTVSPEEREELHLALDYLLNARSGLERIAPGELKDTWQILTAWSEPRQELFREASKFLRSVLGEKLHAVEMAPLLEIQLSEDSDGFDVLAALVRALRTYLPLFAPIVDGKEREEFVANLIEDLVGIQLGDEPRFFQIAKRTQGSPMRPFRIAYLRRNALDWEKRLAVVEFKPYERQSIVSQAFKTSWEAIRKWSQSIELTGELISHPVQYPNEVLKAYRDDPEGFLQMIRDDGEAYWAELSGKKPEKIRKTFPEFYW